MLQGLHTPPPLLELFGQHVRVCTRVGACVHVCLSVCVCVCVGGYKQTKRHCARPGEPAWRGMDLEAALCQCLLSWAQGLGDASSFSQPFSQGINRGTFSSVMMIKTIIINRAIANISLAPLPRPQDPGQTANLLAL